MHNQYCTFNQRSTDLPPTAGSNEGHFARPCAEYKGRRRSGRICRFGRPHDRFGFSLFRICLSSAAIWMGNEATEETETALMGKIVRIVLRRQCRNEPILMWVTRSLH